MYEADPQQPVEIEQDVPEKLASQAEEVIQQYNIEGYTFDGSEVQASRTGEVYTFIVPDKIAGRKIGYEVVKKFGLDDKLTRYLLNMAPLEDFRVDASQIRFDEDEEKIDGKVQHSVQLNCANTYNDAVTIERFHRFVTEVMQELGIEIPIDQGKADQKVKLDTDNSTAHQVEAPKSLYVEVIDWDTIDYEKKELEKGVEHIFVVPNRNIGREIMWRTFQALNPGMATRLIKHFLKQRPNLDDLRLNMDQIRCTEVGADENDLYEVNFFVHDHNQEEEKMLDTVLRELVPQAEVS